MKILITGANGFIGKNLVSALEEQTNVDLIQYTKDNTDLDLAEKIQKVDCIVHLAGSNRPDSVQEYHNVNYGLTCQISNLLRSKFKATGIKTPIIFSSSIHSELSTPYGISKKKAEDVLLGLISDYKWPVSIIRLPNVFGKWCRPNYNSVVATFCHNIANNIPIAIDDPKKIISLVYIDDVVSQIKDVLFKISANLILDSFVSVKNVHQLTVGEIANMLEGFEHGRSNLWVDNVGTGLTRALYSTYLSYLPISKFSYKLKQNIDSRGSFTEVIKTKNSGQFSYLTAAPGVTRGGHYHHTKCEKFLVIQGTALFKSRKLNSSECVELITCSKSPEIVETIPGWTHDLTNIGTNELIVIIWANEVFDKENPDTYQCSVKN